jgi:hypothetical protein
MTGHSVTVSSTKVFFVDEYVKIFHVALEVVTYDVDIEVLEGPF